jgi:hypothetical protein
MIPSPITPPPQPRNDRLIALFLLGVVLFTPPLLRVFGVPVTVFGCPLLFIYIFLAWAIVVALTALDVERRDEPKRPPSTAWGSPPP